MGRDRSTVKGPPKCSCKDWDRRRICGRRLPKKTQIRKWQNGDIWCLFFAILDSRTAEIGIEKVTSHLEEIAFEALEADLAFICDVIGNALVD